MLKQSLPDGSLRLPSFGCFDPQLRPCINDAMTSLAAFPLIVLCRIKSLCFRDTQKLTNCTRHPVAVPLTKLTVMVHLAPLIAVAASILPHVFAVPSHIDKRINITLRKGTSGNKITMKDVVDRDLARLAAVNNKSPSHLEARDTIGPAINQDVTYVAPIKICRSVYSLIVDTGSSNTWVCVT